MSGTLIGAVKVAAARIGLPLEQYEARRAAGEKWCTGCKAWHPATHFPVDRSRGDGVRAKCLTAERGRPRGPRDPAKERARRAVAYAVRKGTLPPPNSLPCTDCGHLEPGRRHEYDHYKGYEPAQWLTVQPVCTLCHADREKERGR